MIISDNINAVSTPVRWLVGTAQIAPLGVFTSRVLDHGRGADRGMAGVPGEYVFSDHTVPGLFYRWEIYMVGASAPAGGVTGYSAFRKPGSANNVALGSATIGAGGIVTSAQGTLYGLDWTLYIANGDAVVTVTVSYVMKLCMVNFV